MDMGSGVATDLLVHFDNGEIVHAYSQPLMIASHVFRTMLTSGMQEANSKEIRLPEKSKAEFEVLVDMLQPLSGRALDPSTADFIGIWADEYHIPLLKNKCEAYMISQKPVCRETLVYAMKYHFPQLGQHCLQVMLSTRAISLAIDNLDVLATEPDWLAKVWMAICNAANFPVDMQPAEATHLAAMWPIIASAVRGGIVLKNTQTKLEETQAEMENWPTGLYNILPQCNQADTRARDWLASKIVELSTTN